MVKPGGLMIAATLNRTLKSSRSHRRAEYVLRWLAGARINGTNLSRRKSSNRLRAGACK